MRIPMAADKDKKEQGGERLFTVLLALGANMGVGILKLVAGLITGSGALLSEAAHSVGDCTTEILLIVALRRSDRPADREHPFGYGKERYFWSLIAAGAIFVSGAVFSFFQGFHTIFGGGESSAELWINYPVLGLAFIFEGTSFLQAMRQMRSHAARQRRSLRNAFTDPDDPTVNSVAMEDSAALVGLALAALGVGLHQITGDPIYDGIASVLIGVLLLSVAFVLAHACQELLVGKQASTRLLQALERELEAQDEVLDVVDLLTMRVGADRVLMCTRVDFVDDLNAADLERACSRIDKHLLDRFDVLDEIFIQPVPRDDERIKERVRSRYGRVMADE
jgi:cation diffusion facilitator family transporter